jgi:hypothetical protein
MVAATSDAMVEPGVFLDVIEWGPPTRTLLNASNLN